MHKVIKKTGKILLGIILGLVLLTFCIGFYLYHSANMLEPKINVDLNDYHLVKQSDSLRFCNGNSLYLDSNGLWECKLKGDAIERGVAFGLLAKDLLKYQEDVFVNQIHELVPSESWVNFLHKLIIIFNRKMAYQIPLELREEIYGMSLSCSHEYDSYGTPYERQLNYHAAHDIGHAMQEYMLVGCSSFAVWGKDSENNKLLIGRNFDFYVGDKFAKNKLILFVEPTTGHKFVSVSWPGMMGVVSGMNDQGLTITLNAAKGAIPISSAMPISLLAREILQYASNIQEAYDIAKQYKTFVSESLLIGSNKDNCAAIIEKTPEQISLFKSNDDHLICTNHYQSETYKDNEYNKDNINNSDSPYRYKRLNQLLSESYPINPENAVNILRNRNGINNEDIGLSNEKSINQFIAHHSVVFSPSELKLWVSTSPWQIGEYVCYDFNNVFAQNNYSLSSASLNIATDSLMLKTDYPNVCKYRIEHKKIKEAIKNNEDLSEAYINEFIANNPHFYEVYNVLGDYMISKKRKAEAVEYWKKALTCEIPTKDIENNIIKKLKKND